MKHDYIILRKILFQCLLKSLFVVKEAKSGHECLAYLLSYHNYIRCLFIPLLYLWQILALPQLHLLLLHVLLGHEPQLHRLLQQLHHLSSQSIRLTLRFSNTSQGARE